jgi:hypothetical protein
VLAVRSPNPRGQSSQPAALDEAELAGAQR